MQQDIEARLQEALSPSQLDIEFQGNHCRVRLVSEQFDGLNKVKRQQLVYACLNDKIASGEIHAVVIEALAPAEL